jgi:hypothetical protein
MHRFGSCSKMKINSDFESDETSPFEIAKRINPETTARFGKGKKRRLRGRGLLQLGFRAYLHAGFGS